MQGQKVLFVGGQGPVSAPALRALAPDNDVFVMARFSNAEVREQLEAIGVTCIRREHLRVVRRSPRQLRLRVRHRAPVDPERIGPERRPVDGSMAELVPTRTPTQPGDFSPTAEPRRASSSPPPSRCTTLRVATRPYPRRIRSASTRRRAYAFTKVANEGRHQLRLHAASDIPATMLIRVRGRVRSGRRPNARSAWSASWQGKPIRLRPDKPTYVRPIFEPDCSRLGVGLTRWKQDECRPWSSTGAATMSSPSSSTTFTWAS